MMAQAAFNRALADIRAMSNNPVVLDATYQLETLSAAFWPANGVDRGETRDRWADYKLTPTECRMMDLFVSKLGKTVSADRMMAVLYFDRNPDDWPNAEITKVHVCKLRKKLVGKPYRLETIWGCGHMLVLAT